MPSVSCRIDAKLSGSWVDITSDVVRGTVRHGHGINGNGPMDVVAGPGELHVMLQNFAKGSRPVGYYSPGHANVRTGWDYGVQIRVVYNDGSDKTRWIGKVAEIEPDADPHGRRCVSVVAYDYQHDLIDASVRAITPQVNQSDSALITAVLDSLPSAAQPLSRSIESGLNTIPFAFDQITETTKAVTAIADVTRSVQAIQYTSGSGVFTYKTRNTRFTASSTATLNDAANITAFSGPTSREGSSNVVRVIYHPKHTTAGIVLWSYTGSTPQVVRAGETITIWTNYRDPNQTSIEIGASSITAPVSGTDYIAKQFSDGTGLTLTSDLSVSTNRYTTATEWTIQNTGTMDAYLTTWQLRGTGIFDDGAQVVEARSTQPYGERILTIDLPYLADRHIAYGIATLVRDQRENPTNLPSRIAFTANRSTTLMTLAMSVEPGDIITVSNAMTGVASATCSVQRIEYEYLQSGSLNVSLTLAATSSITVPPTTPTGLSVANTSDTELTPSWTNTDASAETEIYVGGNLATIAPAGATSAVIGSLTRATNYSITLKHIKYALLRSSATGGVTGRPTVTATGGTITTPGDGYKYHTFTSGGTFAITGRGRVSYTLVGGGGGGGMSNDVAVGGGGGGGGQVLQQTDNDEPVGSFSVVIGSGGAGANSSNFGSNGTNTTYRSEEAVGGGGGGSYVGGHVDGRGGANGGGGSGDGGAGGVGSAGFNGGSAPGYTGGNNTGGGGGGAGGAGSNGVDGGGAGAVGGAGGSGVSVWGSTYGAGGRGGGPGGGFGANGTNYGDGGEGKFNGLTAGTGKQGIAVFRYPI